MSAFNKRKSNRRGVATVEFALAAPILFLLVFGCIEFGRVSMIEAMLEDATFQSARHVTVIGATVDEATEFANQGLGLLGVSNAEIVVEPIAGGVIQQEIDFDTEFVTVTVSVPMRENLLIGGLLPEFTLTRTATIATERVEAFEPVASP